METSAPLVEKDGSHGRTWISRPPCPVEERYLPEIACLFLLILPGTTRNHITRASVDQYNGTLSKSARPQLGSRYKRTNKLLSLRLHLEPLWWSPPCLSVKSKDQTTTQTPGKEDDLASLNPRKLGRGSSWLERSCPVFLLSCLSRLHHTDLGHGWARAHSGSFCYINQRWMKYSTER